MKKTQHGGIHCHQLQYFEFTYIADTNLQTARPIFLCDSTLTLPGGVTDWGVYDH